MRKIAQLREIEARFPYMFKGPNLGLVHYRGWFPLFEQLCIAVDAVLDENKRAFRWIQINERFGSAQFYFHIDRQSVESPGTAEVDHTDSFIYALVLRAERLSSRICMLCSNPAEPVEVDDCIWTLCTAHRPAQGVRGDHQKKTLDKAFQACRLA